MILEILADTRQVRDHVDPGGLQVVGGPDAGLLATSNGERRETSLPPSSMTESGGWTMNFTRMGAGADGRGAGAGATAAVGCSASW